LAVSRVLASKVGPTRLRSRENFPYEFKAGPAGGRLRRPSSAGSSST
jgi:hypothetical protein